MGLMVREVDFRWNQIYASLMLMYEKLVKFGLAIPNEKPIMILMGDDRDSKDQELTPDIRRYRK